MSTSEARFEFAFDDRLILHFDVDGHALKLDTFIATARSAEKVLQSLDEAFFDGKAGLYIEVVPPIEGSFMSVLKVVGTSLSLVYAFIVTPPGSAFIEGLTGHPTEYWSRQIGEEAREFIEELPKSLDNQEEEEFNDAPLPEELVKVHDVCRSVMSSMTRGVLESTEEKLILSGMNIGALPDALDARAEFYENCVLDTDLKGLGFGPDDEFPIRRNTFAERSKRPKRKENPEGEPTWEVNIEEVYVTSPNWDKSDRQRKWKGKDAGYADCYFTIQDEDFWALVERKSLLISTFDLLKVQWAVEYVGKKVKRRHVLRVLEYNGNTLAAPFDEITLSDLLSQITDGDTDPYLPFIDEGRTKYL